MDALALRPSQPVRPIPYGLVSLRDMINFNLHALLWTWVLIRQDYSLSAKENDAAPPGTRLSEKDQARLQSNLNGIADTLNALFIAQDRLGTIQALVRNRGPYAELAHELKALGSDLLSATQYERFYHYPRDKGVLVLRVQGDWAAVLAAFPSAAEDIRAAVDCYALGHPNASIYHSMMVLERGLPLLAKKLKLPVNRDRATWAPIIDNIRAEIDRRRIALGRTPRGSAPLTARQARAERKLLEPCQEAAIEFRYFADVWRNHIAHGRGNYEDEDAKRVLDHVRTFMDVIATKLSLKERT
jgi:hypothetical protein